MRWFAAILWPALCISGCGSSAPPSYSPQWSGETKYDSAICAASKDYLPIPHHLFGCALYRAQLYQESLLDPLARSPAGAVGIAQFMPATWVEVLEQMGEGYADRTVAGLSIRAGAYYMSRLRAGWTSERPEDERMRLSQAAYNAGFGGALSAQRRCGGLMWADISPCLPSETQTYVQRIWRYWTQWKLG